MKADIIRCIPARWRIKLLSSSNSQPFLPSGFSTFSRTIRYTMPGDMCSVGPRPRANLWSLNGKSKEQMCRTARFSLRQHETVFSDHSKTGTTMEPRPRWARFRSPRKWRKCNLVSGDRFCGQRHGLAMNWVDRPCTNADERMLSGAALS